MKARFGAAGLAVVIGASAVGCSGGAHPVAAWPGCPTVLASGKAAPLQGHVPSGSAKAALQLFLQVNHAAIKQRAGTNVNQDLSNLVGEFDLPTDHWVLVKSPHGVAVYEHGGTTGRHDFQVVVGRTTDPSGWSVESDGRCS